MAAIHAALAASGHSAKAVPVPAFLLAPDVADLAEPSDGGAPPGEDVRWALALQAIALLAAAPARAGGIVVRAAAGPVRDAWEAALAAALPGRCRRLPAHADAEALEGGIDLTATLAAGHPVQRAGLLAEAAGGVLVVPMAERLAPSVAARLAAACDGGGPALVLFDESGGEHGDGIAAALADRLAMWIDLGAVRLGVRELLDGSRRSARPRRAPPSHADTAGHISPNLGMSAVVETSAAADALTAGAITLGIASVRAPLHALRIARAHAALHGRAALARVDLEAAAALVLGPRATCVPAEDPPPPDDAPPPPPPEADGDADSDPRPDDFDDHTEILLDAAKVALPPGLLEALGSGQVRRAPPRGSGAGAKLRSTVSGRPAGVRAGVPGRGARLALIDTIKAAAPWQAVRRQEIDPDQARSGRTQARHARTGPQSIAFALGERGEADEASRPRLLIRRDDLRIRRFVARTQTTTIFAVDASGSAAIARLAEAKGAVELLLAQAYVKRAEVALVAFRGPGADLLLPPTRSLARAKRELAGLAGGGGTPLAAGIDAARVLAEAERRRGRTPLVVLLTDGRANIADAGREPQAAALVSAAAFAATGIAAVFIDSGKRPRAEAAAVAAAMRARYVALPRLDARAVATAVEAMG